MNNIFVSTFPFGKQDPTPINLLDRSGISYRINPLNKKLTEDELIDLLGDATALIAGTETISERVLNKAKNLKIISRVGIGLDSLDLNSLKKRKIKLTYTPDAPAPAVAELTIAFVYSLLRSVHLANNQMHKGIWTRYLGKRIPEVTFGIVGCGRIGSMVIEKLLCLGANEILINDISNKVNLFGSSKIKQVSKDEVYSRADLISLHLPLNNITRNMIDLEKIKIMKKKPFLINTSRGGIINEEHLVIALSEGFIKGAAIDVFETEPYHGDLSGIENCILTSHMGSMSEDCRARMELEATEEVIRYLNNIPLQNEVPNVEYSSFSSGGKR